MDILIHTLSGTTVATGIAGVYGKSKIHKLQLIGIGAFAGALPDFDAFSLWSKFDQTIGNWLSLSHTGREIYFGKLWYSHHAFLHSILGALTCIAFFTTIYLIFRSLTKRKPKLPQLILPASTFFFAFCSHLLGDMPTPASVWGGIALWFPHQEYIGGWGKVWWWNNYDIFLILATCTSLNTLLALILKQGRLKWIQSSLVVIALIGIVYQCNTRGFDFAYTEHTSKFQEYEQKSLEIQKRILGDKLYKTMLWFDSKLPVYF